MKRCIWFAILGVVLGSIVIPAQGAGLIIIEDTHWWPGPRPPHPMPPWPAPPEPRPYLFAPLEVDYVKVKTRITDQVAVTSVDQEFYNRNLARLEGTFLFPIPKGAHIDKFTMEIDGKPVQAELLGADKARGIYEDIVRNLRDPALLEYSGRDVFKVRIFPIEPNSRKRITVSYTQLLKSEDGLVNYELPLNTEKFSAKPIRNVSVKVDLESNRPLKSIYSPSHTVEIKRRGEHNATIGYEASDVRPDTDFSLYFAPEKNELGINLLTHRTSGKDGYFLLLASPGLSVKEKQVIPKDVAFVLDTSGSMAGKKLEQAKKALQFCVENLNDTDRFELIRFSTEVEPLFDKLVTASPKNRTQAEEFIKDLKPMGGTAIDDALKKALDLRNGGDTYHRSLKLEDNDSDEMPSTANGRPFVVIFLTDGQPTIGTTDPEQILAGVKHAGHGRTRIFCFGIGTDVNTHLLDRITEETHAYSTYVLPEEDLEVKISNFFAKIKEPLLSNPKLRFTSVIRATKLYPSPLPDLFKGEQLALVGRYSGHGPAAVILEGTVNGETKTFSYDVKFPEESSDNEFIPRLWATRRVGYLLDEIRLHGESSELRDEITQLARKYGIVTPYTAYLILDDEARRGVPLAMQSLQGLQRDRDARNDALNTWSEFKEERAGDGGVANARMSYALKAAEAPVGAVAGATSTFNRRYGLAAAPPPSSVTRPQAAEDSKTRLTQYAQQSQFVNGKNFFQNNNQWTDSAVQSNQNAKRVRIQFGSPEYFTLAANTPNARPWLALGQNVQFYLDNTIYEVYE